MLENDRQGHYTYILVDCNSGPGTDRGVPQLGSNNSARLITHKSQFSNFVNYNEGNGWVLIYDLGLGYWIQLRWIELLLYVYMATFNNHIDIPSKYLHLHCGLGTINIIR